MGKNVLKLPEEQTNESGIGGESQPLIMEAYRGIKQMLFQQKLIPGQKLIYSDLGEMLDMSRTPIINALNRLEQEGFVVSENFRGFYVKPIDLGEIWDAFGLREALEIYAVEMAIKSGNPDDIQSLEQIRITHANYTPPYYTQKKFLLDIEFHTQIASMAKNRILTFQLKRNFEHLYLRSRLNNYDVTRMEVSARDHKKLVDSIKNRDVLRSVELIRSHVQSARDLVMNCLSKDME